VARFDLDFATKIGARVLMTGYLGDEVWFASGVLRDLSRGMRAPAVARTIFRRGLRQISRRDLRELWLGFLPPPVAVRIANRLLENPSPPREWWGPVLRELGPVAPEVIRLPASRWPSHVCCAVWSQLTGWRTTAITEAITEYGVEAGIEVRSPHADVRIADLVLRMPWQQREPRGHYRRTGREALGHLLPRELASRVDQPPWTDVWNATASRMLPAFAPLFFEGPWRSESFVDRAMVKAMFRQCMAAGVGSNVPDLALVLRIGALEAWLRGLLG